MFSLSTSSNNVISYHLLTTNGREKNKRHLMCKLLFFFVVELTCNNDDNSYFFLIVYQESVKHNAKIVLFYREINFEKIQIRLQMWRSSFSSRGSIINQSGRNTWLRSFESPEVSNVTYHDTYNSRQSRSLSWGSNETQQFVAYIDFLFFFLLYSISL